MQDDEMTIEEMRKETEFNNAKASLELSRQIVNNDITWAIFWKPILFVILGITFFTSLLLIIKKGNYMPKSTKAFFLTATPYDCFIAKPLFDPLWVK